MYHPYTLIAGAEHLSLQFSESAALYIYERKQQYDSSQRQRTWDNCVGSHHRAV